MTNQVSYNEMKTLISTGIITLKGISGTIATLDQAAQAPQVIQAHSMSGLTFDLGYNDGTFTLKEI
jgi:hypothetical protein